METLYYVAKSGDITKGIFGTLYECCKWVLVCEFRDEEPSSDDPLESLFEILDDSTVGKYELNAAEVFLTKLLTVEEGVDLPGAPRDVVNVDEFRAWLDNGYHDVDVLRAAADILYARTASVRWRGAVHTVGMSPFTAEQYDQLVRQLS
jgi:hypothetical protein